MLTQVGRRPETSADGEFLRRLYASTREEELSRVDWPEEEKRAFLEMQFRAQRDHYRRHFPDASYEVLLLDGRPAGRLYLDRRDDEIRVVDIALLPEHRGRGIGSALMKGILGEARAAGKAVRIHVEHFNQALRLYGRLGFRRIADQGVYYLLEWSP